MLVIAAVKDIEIGRNRKLQVLKIFKKIIEREVIIMPRGDGTGPAGQGPGTGKGDGDGKGQGPGTGTGKGQRKDSKRSNARKQISNQKLKTIYDKSMMGSYTIMACNTGDSCRRTCIDDRLEKKLELLAFKIFKLLF